MQRKHAPRRSCCPVVPPLPVPSPLSAPSTPLAAAQLSQCQGSCSARQSPRVQTGTPVRAAPTPAEAARCRRRPPGSLPRARRRLRWSSAWALLRRRARLRGGAPRSAPCGGPARIACFLFRIALHGTALACSPAQPTHIDAVSASAFFSGNHDTRCLRHVWENEPVPSPGTAVAPACCVQPPPLLQSGPCTRRPGAPGRRQRPRRGWRRRSCAARRPRPSCSACWRTRTPCSGRSRCVRAPGLGHQSLWLQRVLSH
jgi:hypothetical protein